MYSSRNILLLRSVRAHVYKAFIMRLVCGPRSFSIHLSFSPFVQFHSKPQRERISVCESKQRVRSGERKFTLYFRNIFIRVFKFEEFQDHVLKQVRKKLFYTVYHCIKQLFFFYFSFVLFLTSSMPLTD